MSIITVESLKQYFMLNYSYISIDFSDSDYQDFIDSHNDVKKLAKLADFLSDYILSQGLADDVME